MTLKCEKCGSMFTFVLGQKDQINKIECPHCKLRSKNAGNMKRWHFDECKLKN